MAGWQEREAYFKEHGPKPEHPYIDKSEWCGCYEVWETPAMGAAYKCDRCAGLARDEMREVQQRRYAAAGLVYEPLD